MTQVTTTYSITHLVSVEVTRFPRTRSKKIELIIGGEARSASPAELLSMLRTLEEIKRDLKLK
jgi:hypothetical protein